MPALLLSPLFKLGAIAVAALALWGYVSYQGARIDRLTADVETHKRNEAVKDGALKAALAALDEIKANEARATAALAVTEGKMDDARKQLAASRRAIRGAPAAVAQCGLPPKLLALADSLRKSTPARSGDTGPDHQAPPSGRIAAAVPARP